MGYWETVEQNELELYVGGTTIRSHAFINLRSTQTTGDNFLFGGCHLKGDDDFTFATQYDKYISKSKLSEDELYKIDFTGYIGDEDKYKTIESKPFNINDGAFIFTTPKGHLGKTIKGTARLRRYKPTLPSQPTSLDLTGKVQVGKQVKLNWGKSNYFEDEYILERKVNSDDYIPIYKGKDLSTTDIIGYDWNTVRYRVKGINEDGESSYRYMPSKTVIKHKDFSIWTKVNGQVKEVGDMGFNINGRIVKASDLLR